MNGDGERMKTQIKKVVEGRGGRGNDEGRISYQFNRGRGEARQISAPFGARDNNGTEGGQSDTDATSTYVTRITPSVTPFTTDSLSSWSQDNYL